MKRIKLSLIVLLLLMLGLNMTSCRRHLEDAPLDQNNEVVEVLVTETKAQVSPSYLIEQSNLIIRGRILQKNGEVMSNPDNTLVNKEGVLIGNALITDYTVAIDQVYKGDFDGETIQVKTNYGDGLSPEMILNGEGNGVVLGNTPKKVELSTEGDCILLLTYIDTGYEESSGYFPIMMLGYLTPDGNGAYTNHDSDNPVTVSPDTLASEIAALTH